MAKNVKFCYKNRFRFSSFTRYVGLYIVVISCSRQPQVPIQPQPTTQPTQNYQVQQPQQQQPIQQPIVEQGVPSGTIVAFYGPQVPEGWTICDGRLTPTGLKTPDLRDKFIMGTAAFNEIGVTGGTSSHSHAISIGSAKGGSVGTDRDTDAWVSSPVHKHTASATTANHIPPHVKLIYIMKN